MYKQIYKTMNTENIKKMLQDQLSKPMINKRRELSAQETILHNITNSKLPFYRKYTRNMVNSSGQQTKIISQVYKIHIRDGRLEVDRIKILDHRVEFDTNNHSIAIDSSFEDATIDDWKMALDKLLSYISRNYKERYKNIIFG